MSSCKPLLNFVFKSHLIVIRRDDTTFLATWDDTGNAGVVNLTTAELKEFTTSTDSDRGEHITSMFLEYLFNWYRAYSQKSVY